MGYKNINEIENRRAIQENEARFKKLFDSSPEVIFLADIETGIIVDANFAASKLLWKPVT